MSPSRRENMISEVEKFLEDSAKGLPPMRECAKEPVCIKERARVKNGVVSRHVDDRSRGHSNNQKLADWNQPMPARTKKSAADQQTHGKHAAASTVDWRTSAQSAESAANKLGNSKTASAEKPAADLLTIAENSAPSITALQTLEKYPVYSTTSVGNASLIEGSKLRQNTPNPSLLSKELGNQQPKMSNHNLTNPTSKHRCNNDQGPFTDPSKNSPLPSREAVNEPLCIKQHYIRGAGYTGLRDTVMYPNAIPFQLPWQDRPRVPINARPLQQPQRHPGPSSTQESPNQAQGNRPRHPGNPRNIHQYVNYDNCTENVREVDHNEP